MRMRLRIRIVLIVIDRFADVVLPLIDLLMLLRRQMAAVCRTVRRSLMIDARLAVLEVGCFMRSKLAGLNALANTLLLVLRAHSRPRECRILRTPAVHRSKIAAIGTRHLHMVLLFSRGGNMVLPRIRSLLHARDGPEFRQRRR